jgi:hypothetical protein
MAEAAGWYTIAQPAIGDALGAQGDGKRLRRVEALAGFGLEKLLGGSDGSGVRSASYVAVPMVMPRTLVPASGAAANLTFTIFVRRRTDDAATSVTWRLRNTTDGTTLATGTSSTSTTFAEESTAIVPVAGKVYELQITGNNATHSIYAYGWVEATGT